MAGVSTPNWKQLLEQAVLRAKAQVVGWQNIREVQHGLLIATALTAFGEEPRATFFIEVRSTAGNIPRPDLILLHPQTGVLVIENKGIALGDIHAAQNTTLKVVRDGRLKDEDPFLQAERVLLRLRDLTGLRADLREVLFLHTAALPRIGREDFERHFEVRWPDETLFAEECGDPARFRAHLCGFADHTQRKAFRAERLSRRANDAVLTVLNGKSFIYGPRRTHIEESDPSLIGVQVQQLELGLKDATQQQKELGRADLRGSHRLFRGVAGSGKSIMLALSVAQTLTRYRADTTDLFGSPGPNRPGCW